jgi:hypothetical protein
MNGTTLIVPALLICVWCLLIQQLGAAAEVLFPPVSQSPFDGNATLTWNPSGASRGLSDVESSVRCGPIGEELTIICHKYPTPGPGLPQCCCRYSRLPRKGSSSPSFWEFACLPSFVIVGAQKSGSSALFGYMLRHPSVLPSRRKEVCGWLGGWASRGCVSVLMMLHPVCSSPPAADTPL